MTLILDQNILIEQSVTLIEQSSCKIALRINLKRCNLHCRACLQTPLEESSFGFGYRVLLSKDILLRLYYIPFRRHTVMKRKVIPLPLYKVDPQLHPQGLFRLKQVRFMYF